MAGTGWNATPSSSSSGAGTPAAAPGAALPGWGSQGSSTNRYDPNEFYTRATDDKGHSKRFTVDVSPLISNELTNMVYSDDFPDYQSPQDVIRDAIVHVMHKRRDQQTDPAFREHVEKTVRLLVFEKMVADMADEATRWAVVRDNFDKSTAALANEGAWDHLREYLVRARDSAEELDEPYRTKMLDRITVMDQRVANN